jgi:hypothetical protein
MHTKEEDIQVQIGLEATVGQLKKKVSKITPIPAYNQALYFDNEQLLDDDIKLADLKIKNMSNLMVFWKFPDHKKVEDIINK